MQSQTPHTSSTDNAIDLAKNGSWQRIFQITSPTSDLSGEVMWPQANTSYIKELAQDPNLVSQAVEAALSLSAWHFLNQLLHEGFAKACPPSTLLASPNFVAPISAVDRPLTDADSEKISLWRSILVANPWHTIELSDKERSDWKKLSHATLEALAKSSTPGNTFSNPGHLIHVVDTVNVAINSARHENQGPYDDVRVGLREAVSRLVDCAGQTGTPLQITSGALTNLNFPMIIQEREIRTEVFAGIQDAQEQVAARSLLHHLACQDGPVSQWYFRVSAATRLWTSSPAPVASMFGLLAEAKDPSVRAVAIKAISQHLRFPLSRDVRDEVAHLGPLGGQILSHLIAGLDNSQGLSGWFDGLPLLIRQYTQAAAAAHVDHGIDQKFINSLSVEKGGPLSPNQVFEALVGLDPISPEGFGTFIRGIIRA